MQFRHLIKYYMLLDSAFAVLDPRNQTKSCNQKWFKWTVLCEQVSLLLWIKSYKLALAWSHLFFFLVTHC